MTCEMLRRFILVALASTLVSPLFSQAQTPQLQPLVTNGLATDHQMLIGLTNSISAIQAGLTNISTNLTGLHSEVGKLKRSFWTDLGQNMLGELIYDILKSRVSPQSIIARWTTRLGFVFVVLRILFLVLDRKKDKPSAPARGVQWVLNIYVVGFLTFAATILWGRPPSGHAAPQVDTAPLERKIETLSDKLKSAQSTLEECVKRSQTPPCITNVVIMTNFVPMHLTQEIAQITRSLSNTSERFLQAKTEIGSMVTNVTNLKSHSARKGWQTFQTWLLVAVVAALAHLVIPWKKLLGE